jgi:hypothetical protein
MWFGMRSLREIWVVWGLDMGFWVGWMGKSREKKKAKAKAKARANKSFRLCLYSCPFDFAQGRAVPPSAGLFLARLKACPSVLPQHAAKGKDRSRSLRDDKQMNRQRQEQLQRQRQKQQTKCGDPSTQRCALRSG